LRSALAVLIGKYEGRGNFKKLGIGGKIM